MILKKGITGFFDCKDSPVPEMDFKIFKTLCHTIDNCTQWKFIHINSNPDGNYYSAEFKTSSGIIYLLLNKHYPIIGFTQQLNIGDIVFTDNNDISYLLGNYEIVSADILNGWIDDVVNELSEVEQSQVEYWNPSSVGNVVFNSWD